MTGKNKWTCKWPSNYHLSPASACLIPITQDCNYRSRSYNTWSFNANSPRLQAKLESFFIFCSSNSHVFNLFTIKRAHTFLTLSVHSFESLDEIWSNSFLKVFLFQLVFFFFLKIKSWPPSNVYNLSLWTEKQTNYRGTVVTCFVLFWFC